MEHEPTVFVVDDDPAMRESLRWLLGSVHLAVETFEDASVFLERLDPERPGCVVSDVRMPKMSGLDLQNELTARGIVLPVILLTGFAEVPMAVQAIKAGAVDFIEKPFSDQLLLDRIQQAIELDRERRTIRLRHADYVERLAHLSAREREVMTLVVAGKSNREIADAFGLSVKTVEIHRARVMEKMRAESLAELTRIAVSLETAGIAKRSEPR